MTVRAIFRKWIDRYFSDEEAVILLVILLMGFAAVIFLGGMLAPFFTALVIAFLLQGLINILTRRHVPEMIAVASVFLLFIGVMLALGFLLMPLLWNQLVNLVQETPRMLTSAQQWIVELQSHYPTLIEPDAIQNWVSSITKEFSVYGQRAVSFSLASLGNVIGIIIYLVLVPILIFFMLKDRVGFGVKWMTKLQIIFEAKYLK